MKKPNLLVQSLASSVAEVGYITLIALFMQSANKIFGQEDKFITPIAVLLLLVISAAISGYLILGNPILLYLEGQKKQGIKLFGYTLGWLIIWLIVVLVILALLK